MKSKQKIIFATSNRGKVIEARKIAGDLSVDILAPNDLIEAGLISSPFPEVPESYETYLENAKAKADAAFAWCKMPSFGDDSGLEVEYLNGAPGVITARYAGPNATSAENMAKLLAKLQGVSNRGAAFRCCLFLRSNPDLFLQSEAVLRGRISEEPRGDGGFGYDPVFIPDGSELTLAELKQSGKPVKTHRSMALEKLIRDILDTA